MHSLRKNIFNEVKSKSDLFSKINLKSIIDLLNSEQLNLINYRIDKIAHNLSVRSYNALSNYLRNDFSISNYYENILCFKYFNFKNIRNIGDKSLKELETFNEKILRILYNSIDIDENVYIQMLKKKKKDEIEIIEKDELEIIINSLNSDELILINKYLNIKIKRLSVRGYNSINKFLKENICINNYYQNILKKKNFTFKILRNVGVRTLKELENINNEIIKYLKNIKKLPNVRLEFYKLVILDEFKLSYSEVDAIFTYFPERKICIFELFNYLLLNSRLYTKVELTIFNNRFNLCEGENELTLEEIGNKVDLTRERIRQIQLSLINNLNIKLEFVKSFNISDINTYGIDVNADLIYFPINLVNEISKNENVCFSHLLYEKIYSNILEKTHSIIETEYLKKTKFSHNYLIAKELTYSFDFLSFLNDIYDGLKERIKNTYEINLREFILCYQKKKDGFDIDRVFNTCKQLLFIEHNINTDIAGNIKINRNTPILAHEYLIEILKIYKKPMHYSELYDECIKRGYPAKSPQTVHANIQREPQIFGLKGPGTFGLLEWGGYYGTIGDVTEKYLKEKNIPLPFNEVVEFINNELIISQDSINNVLFNYKNENRFVKLRSNKIALKEWFDK